MKCDAVGCKHIATHEIIRTTAYGTGRQGKFCDDCTYPWVKAGKSEHSGEIMGIKFKLTMRRISG